MPETKLINAPENCVEEMLKGFVAAYPQLAVLPEKKIVMLRTRISRKDKVALITGGGAGHEPHAAGFIGEGMLTAIVSGAVFASPPASNILHAIRNLAKDSQAGILVFIANYTGDCLNFGLAIERARLEKIKIESVEIGDDCSSLLKSETSFAGRRGLCGMSFVFKIVGAMAEEGKSLEELKSAAEILISSIATMGLCLHPCSLPGSGPLFTLAEGEVELGLGVHGEAGVKKIKIGSASEMIELVLKYVKQTLNLQSGDEVVALINNLGSTCLLEQWIVTGEVKSQLESQGISVLRMYAGPLKSSLDMAGIHVSLLKVGFEEKSSWIKYLDAVTTAAAWPGCTLSVPFEEDIGNIEPIICDCTKIEDDLYKKIHNINAELVEKCLLAVVKAFKENEDQINQLDTGCGDGDCGSTLVRWAEEILTSIEKLKLNTPAVLLNQLAIIAEETMGGTSGGLYSLFLTTAATAISSNDDDDDDDDDVTKICALAWNKGLEGLMKYTHARVGDRTMMDALIPACNEFTKRIESGIDGINALEAAVKEAELGCQKTKDMGARYGRASYVAKSYLTKIDAGAYGVTLWLKAIYNSISKKKLK